MWGRRGKRPTAGSLSEGTGSRPSRSITTLPWCSWAHGVVVRSRAKVTTTSWCCSKLRQTKPRGYRSKTSRTLSADGQPGPEEIFGSYVLLDDLRAKIGRDEDTNANLTRRMLLMLESVAICGERVHADARRALIAGYLDANVKEFRPPRFLLNDVIRYWRTIAVDFESKMRARKGEGWGLRNAKLRL